MARYARNGQARLIQASHFGTTTTVIRGPGNQRTIETVQPNGVRIVNYGPNTGFTERPIVGRPGFVSRTFVKGRSSQIAIYRMYTYQHHSYYRYVPSVYYQPAFYGWLISPWPAALAFDWGAPVGGGYYGSYFMPYANYPSADPWLSDYVLNSDLQAAYAEQQPGDSYPTGYPQSTDTGNTEISDNSQPYPLTDPAIGADLNQQPLSPNIKAQISSQVSSHIVQLQNISTSVSEGESDIPATLSEDLTPDSLKPENKAFVVSTDIQLDVSDDQSCVLTPGDVLFRATDTPDPDGKVKVVVEGRKRGDCENNTTGSLSVAALEEMNNQFNQQIDEGIAILAAKGSNGTIPNAPATASTRLQIASSQQIDPSAAQSLQQNQAAGQQVQSQLTAATSSVIQ